MPVPEAPKYCRSCIHRDVKGSGTREENYQCRHPKNLLPDVSLVTGIQDPRQVPEYLRSVEFLCGPEGKWHTTHEQRTAAYNIISPARAKELSNPSLTLLQRLSKIKIDVDKL